MSVGVLVVCWVISHVSSFTLKRIKTWPVWDRGNNSASANLSIRQKGNLEKSDWLELEDSSALLTDGRERTCSAVSATPILRSPFNEHPSVSSMGEWPTTVDKVTVSQTTASQRLSSSLRPLFPASSLTIFARNADW
ncbi:hypothetical protein C8F01DRAFT_1143128 [Mycena amicta]|nr:hypothetical protein C8F01DRAFT_1143128 [Mycena amicta]